MCVGYKSDSLKIFLSGEPGVGKSTVLSNLCQKLNNSNIFGCVVKEVRRHDQRCGFSLVKIPSQEETLLASSVEVLSDVFISKYSVNVDAIQNDLLPFMQAMASHPSAGILIFDEIGRMQNTSPYFLKTLDDLLLTRIPLIATLVHDKESWAEPYKNRTDTFYMTLTPKNRDYVPQIIYDLFKSSPYLNFIPADKYIKIIALFRQLLYEERYAELEKLCNHTIKYIAQNRIAFESKANGFIIEGDHQTHTVVMTSGAYRCSCSFYANNSVLNNMCSHIQSVMIHTDV